MKILVVDDEHSFGALLGHTLKRLGHKPVLAVHPMDALEMLTDDIDAVITDIDMPVMNGVDLAAAIRDRDTNMPIAFCTGSCPEGESVARASRFGRVLPKVWTVADVKEVVEELRRQRSGRQRRESVANLYAQMDDDTTETPLPPPVRRTRPPSEGTTRERRVRISFSRWKQVKRLCDDRDRGPVSVTVPCDHDMTPGDELSISLLLPDEITVKVAGEVRAIRPGRPGRRQELSIELTGFTDRVAARMRAMAFSNESDAAAESGRYLHATPRPRRRHPSGSDTPPPDPTRKLARGSQQRLQVSELLRGNQRLRRQIESLAARMQRRNDEE